MVRMNGDYCDDSSLFYWIALLNIKESSSSPETQDHSKQGKNQ
jgi:hypothetical protein